jgi:hypothetical protein
LLPESLPESLLVSFIVIPDQCYRRVDPAGSLTTMIRLSGARIKSGHEQLVCTARPAHWRWHAP